MKEPGMPKHTFNDCRKLITFSQDSSPNDDDDEVPDTLFLDGLFLGYEEGKSPPGAKQLLNSVLDALYPEATAVVQQWIRADHRAGNHSGAPQDVPVTPVASSSLPQPSKSAMQATTARSNSTATETAPVSSRQEQEAASGVNITQVLTAESETGTNEEPTIATIHAKPVNEYERNGFLLMGAFPTLFVNGTGLPPDCGPLTVRVRRYLLLHFDHRFSMNEHLNFYLHNQTQRAQAARTVSASVDAGRYNQQLFEHIVNTDGFHDKLMHACRYPNSPEAKLLFKQLQRCVSVAGASVDWSPGQRKSALSKLLAMIQYFGLPSLFFTVSPADMDYTMLLQWKESIPTTDDETYHKFSLPCLNKRREILANNPVLAAEVYQIVIKNLLDILIGLPIDCQDTKKSPPPMAERKDGMLGKPIGFFSVTEVQGRGSPHSHMLIWSDLSPLTIKKHLNDANILSALLARLDSVVTCKIDDFIREDSKDTTKGRSKFPCEDSEALNRDHRNLTPQGHLEGSGKKIKFVMTESSEEFKQRGEWVATQTNQHRHADTCHKGNRGRHECREGYPRGLWDRPTSVVELENVQGFKSPLASKTIRAKNPALERNPIYTLHDDRVLVVELHRPSQNPDPAHHENSDVPGHYVDFTPPEGELPGSNAYVASFNVFLSSILGCNVSVEYLGTCAQAKAASFYVVRALNGFTCIQFFLQ
jgi:hypothetical protein